MIFCLQISIQKVYASIINYFINLIKKLFLISKSTCFMMLRILYYSEFCILGYLLLLLLFRYQSFNINCQSVTSQSRDFLFLQVLPEPVLKKKYRNRYRSNLVPYKVLESVAKKVLESVPVKFGTEKKYWYWYRKYLVPKKSTGIGIENIWYRKIISVSFKILGTVTHWP